MKSRHNSTKLIVLALANMYGMIAIGGATIVGFGQLGGNNTQIPTGLASRAVADGNGFVVSNGVTPNIAVTWDTAWDIHTSANFGGIEGLTVGGGAWDNEGSVPRIGQLDVGTHTIVFAADAGFALALNSFDFGQTSETVGTTTWDIVLRNSLSSTVWSQSLTLNSASAATGITTVTPNFTGELGESYTLTFNRTSQTYNSDGRHAIDNLSFGQVPEVSSAALLGLAGLGLLRRRRA